MLAVSEVLLYSVIFFSLTFHQAQNSPGTPALSVPTVHDKNRKGQANRKHKYIY